MSVTPTRGRPATGKARTPAQRMADSRLRALEELGKVEPDLTTVSTTGLLEALRIAVRDGSSWNVATISEELIRRTNERATHKVLARFAPMTDDLEAGTATVARYERDTNEKPGLSRVCSDQTADAANTPVQ